MKEFNLVVFLMKYYGITSPSLNAYTLSHKDIEVLFPFIRTCHYSDVTNELIMKGEIIPVYDKDNVIKYYYNPHLLVDTLYDIPQGEKESITFDLSDISMLSKDELLKLRRKLRIYGLISDAKIVTKLIRKKKKEEPKLYRERREKIKIKESYYD